MNDFHRFPSIAHRYYIDWLFDSVNGGCTALTSPRKWSKVSKVNGILRNIQKEQWWLSYLNNRVREQISVILLQSYIPNIHITLSTIVNDILHHTDAIICVDKDIVAVDLTENFAKIHQKLQKGKNGEVYVEDPKGNTVSLPLSVVYVPSWLVDRTGEEIETYLNTYPNASESELNTHIFSLLSGIIAEDGSNGELNPSFLPSVYMRESRVSNKLQERFFEGYSLLSQVYSNQLEETSHVL